MKMTKLNIALTGLLTSLWLTGPVLAQTGQTEPAATEQSSADNSSDQPLATVNGQPIDQALFDSYAQRRQAQVGDVNSPQARQALTEELIVQELLVQQAEQQNLEDDPQVQQQLEMIRRNLLATAALQKYLQQNPPDEAAVQEQYDQAVSQAEGSEYKARHILVDSEEKAKELISQLDNGADFAELARESSSDTSAAQGGDLGWFQPDVMVPEFAQAVGELDKGGYTKEPVQTQFGWHVIQLDDTRETTPPSIDELRPQITQMLQSQAINGYLSELRQQAEIEMPDQTGN